MTEEVGNIHPHAHSRARERAFAAADWSLMSGGDPVPSKHAQPPLAHDSGLLRVKHHLLAGGIAGPSPPREYEDVHDGFGRLARALPKLLSRREGPPLFPPEQLPG